MLKTFANDVFIIICTMYKIHIKTLNVCACTYCIKFMIGTICSGIQYMSSEQSSIEEAQSFISCLYTDRRWRYCFFCLTTLRFGSLGVIFCFLRREKYIELLWSSYLSTISPSACHSVLCAKQAY